jgi:hypothetical protein
MLVYRELSLALVDSQRDAGEPDFLAGLEELANAAV